MTLGVPYTDDPSAPLNIEIPLQVALPDGQTLYAAVALGSLPFHGQQQIVERIVAAWNAFTGVGTSNIAPPRQCLLQIQEPPTKTEALAHYSQQVILAMGEAGAAPKLDDTWKVRMLDDQPLARDKDGIGYHPALPDFDESVKCAEFFASLGIELKCGMAENEMDSDAYEAMTENGLTDEGDNYNAWTPKRPDGDGWNLVAVFDTEDGPACWWMRDKPFEPQRAEGYRERLDNSAVEVLAMNMKAKLAGQRSKGYRGWNNDCTQQHLSDLLRQCVEKGDPVDVANFCAFLLARGEVIAPQAQAEALDALKPDMFWNADDPESSETSINNVVVEADSYRGLKVGDVVDVQRAVKLPDVSVRITMVPDSEGNGDLQWEEVDAAIAAQAAQQGGAA